MKTSEQIEKLAEALSKAQGAMDAADKDAINPHFGKKYADLASVWRACRKPLADNGLSVIQSPEVSANGLEITTRLMHSSGQWMESTLPMHPTKNDPQGVGSAITYGRRYGLCSMLGIVADEDDDGNGASIPQQRREEPRSQTQSESPRATVPSASDMGDPTAFWTWAKAEVKAGTFTDAQVKQVVAKNHNRFADAHKELTSGQTTAV